MPKDGDIRINQVRTYKRNWLGRRVWVNSVLYIKQFRDGEWWDLDVYVEEVEL